MATSVSRVRFDPIHTFVQHLALKTEASKTTKRAEALKTKLKEWIPKAPAAYSNEQGSVFVDLDETVTVDGVEYSGMEMRRSVRTTFDEDVAEALLKKKNVYDEALSTFVDQEKIYRLHQEGKITDRDIDKMFVEKEQFAFWPVKGEVI